MAGVETPVIVLSDGDEAIAYLSGKGQFSDRARFPMPRVLLLDLNMCRVDGFDVLEWIRTQPQLNDLYVVVLSGHHGLREVNQAYALGAKSFLFKPGEPAQIRELMNNSRRYWADPPSDPPPPPPPPLA